MLLTRLKPFSSSSKLLAPHPRHSSSHASNRTAIQGKKCVVTGASRGIGLAIARRFACEGADTVLVGRDDATLQKAVEQVQSECEGHGSHIARAGDVAQRQFWEDLQQELKTTDILVNAAGISHPSLLASMDPKAAHQTIQTNLMGTIWGCQVLAKGMLDQQSGCIINVSSIIGLKGGRWNSVYAASKAGIIALTRSLAGEIGYSGVRVNALLPGYIDTQLLKGLSPEIRKQLIDAVPTSRFGTVEEVADAAYFLAANAYANNCVLNLDGGASAT
ncbi:MAG: hypothetical protein M1839_003388 [Geoglossum umbratile]|nr:MAG: hypothetical protein M1839_003388 [Geoglossum umbratile]